MIIIIIIITISVLSFLYTVAGFVEKELTFTESANTRQASYIISKGNTRLVRGTITAIPGSAST